MSNYDIPVDKEDISRLIVSQLSDIGSSLHNIEKLLYALLMETANKV